ncbi:DUF2306 domain-containing protein [Roseibium litorale]|uniref:DUF2306 domain-containing protein n=1 Tax=Roseibium litorale TaxID=2803841 RepID=A0ABR9CI35_9HYPH|nr:DUF2306 domain-containing protein [Roseibium litorale]MBD8889976.1 DUF2306 domain-containing protein [Roseibium litorale]
MTLTPLLQAGPVIATHAFAALAALLSGALQLALPKGTFLHKITGYLWIALMLWTAASSLFIHEIRLLGPFSPIHILSIATLIAVPRAIAAARSGKITTHRAIMRSLYFWALIVAGLFTLLPGRIMHHVVFGS